jgi:aryl-alcohol dehydrogenase-like predicted oxidoreductase
VRVAADRAGQPRGVQQRSIGSARVGAIGLGAMPLAVDGRPSQRDADRVVHAALDAGVTLIDTADAYSVGLEDFGYGEEVVARALRSYAGDASGVLVATKGGHTRDAAAGWHLDGRPGYLRSAAEASARRLGVDAVGLYQLHRPDPDVPYAESVGALKDLLDAGTIRMAGISNADPDQIRLSREILGDGLTAVQNELSPAFRSSEPEVALCDEVGLAFLPWSPLGGMGAASALGGEHAAFAEVAEERGVSPQQVCLAWLLAKAPGVIPIPGSSRPETIVASAAAADLELSAEELARLG